METFSLNAKSVPILSLPQSEIDILTNQEFTFYSSTEWGEIELYRWNINDVNIVETTDSSTIFSSEDVGEYFVSVIGKHAETKIWTEEFIVQITVYETPVASFNFTGIINEDDWVNFDGRASEGLGLQYEWILDGVLLSGDEEEIKSQASRLSETLRSLI